MPEEHGEVCEHCGRSACARCWTGEEKESGEMALADLKEHVRMGFDAAALVMPRGSSPMALISCRRGVGRARVGMATISVPDEDLPFLRGAVSDLLAMIDSVLAGQEKGKG